jgi:hypothetical protein
MTGDRRKKEEYKVRKTNTTVSGVQLKLAL